MMMLSQVQQLLASLAKRQQPPPPPTATATNINPPTSVSATASGHPSPTESDPACNSSTSGSGACRDTQSESSQVSPDCPAPATPDDDYGPQDLSSTSSRSYGNRRPTACTSLNTNTSTAANITSVSSHRTAVTAVAGAKQCSPVSSTKSAASHGSLSGASSTGAGGNGNENSGAAVVECAYCGQTLPSETMLQLHLIDSHRPELIALAAQQQQQQQRGNGGLLSKQISDDASVGPAPYSGDTGIKRDETLGAVHSLLQLHSPTVSVENGGNGNGGGGIQLQPPNSLFGDPLSILNEKPKVFNPEAFCELCDKEFCNKYYLATHKATKHGIGSVPSLSGVSLAATMSQAGGGAFHTTDSSMQLISSSATAHNNNPNTNNSVNAFVCNVCGEKCSSEFLLRTHQIQSHQQANCSPSTMDGVTSTTTPPIADIKMSSSGPVSMVQPPTTTMTTTATTLNGLTAAARKLLPPPLTSSMQPQPQQSLSPSVNTGDAAAQAALYHHQQQQQQQPIVSEASASQLQQLLNAQFFGGGGGGKNPFSGGNGQDDQHHHQQQQASPNDDHNNNNNGSPNGQPQGGNSGSALLEQMKLMVQSGLIGPMAAAALAQSLSLPPPDLNVDDPSIGSHSLTNGTPRPAAGFRPDQRSLLSGGSGGLGRFGPLTGSGGIGQSPMINKEAYCEFCNKEFCNKYFLRTHKLKKHGIASEEAMLTGRKRSSTASSVQPTATDSPTLMTTPGRAPVAATTDQLLRLTSSTSPSKPPPSALQSMQMLLNGGGPGLSELAAQQQQQMSPGRSSVIVNGDPQQSPAAKQARLDSDASSKSFSLDGMLSLAQPAAHGHEPGSDEAHECSQCQRTFPSVFSLLAHTYREHQPQQDGGGSPLDQQQQQQQQSHQQQHASAFTPQKPQQQQQQQQQQPGYEQPEPGQTNGNALTALLDSGADGESFACECCKKEFRSAYFLRVHRLTMHGLISEHGTNDQQQQQQQQSPQLNVAQPALNLPNGAAAAGLFGTGSTASAPGSGAAPDTMAALMSHIAVQQQQQQQLAQSVVASAAAAHQQITPGRRSKYVTGKNFCDICNKEVCNKYFLRTHMLKMHGVVIDENKLIIGNIDTADRERMGAVVFRCDICSLEMSTRAELKQHKQAAHGVTPIPASSGGGGGAMQHHMGGGGGNGGCSDDGMMQHSHHQQLSQQHSQQQQQQSPHKPPQPLALGSEVCPVCDARFHASTHLWKHMRAQHAGVISEQLMDSFIKSAEEFEAQQRDDQQQQQQFNADQSSFWDNQHSHSQQQQLDMSQQQQQQQEEAADSTDPQQQQRHICAICGSEHSDAVELNLHVIHTHSLNQQQQQQQQQQHMHPSTSRSSNTSQAGGGGQQDNTDQAWSTTATNVAATTGTQLSHRPFTCAFCPYKTRWQSNLYAHERRHRSKPTSAAGNGVWQSTSSSSLDAWSAQLLAAAGDKPYVCDVCLRGYKYAHSLERHRHMHQLNKSPLKSTQQQQQSLNPCRRWRCRECDKVFRSADQCRTHTLAVHRRAQLVEYTRLLMDAQRQGLQQQQQLASPQRAVLDTVATLVTSVDNSDDVQECTPEKRRPSPLDHNTNEDESSSPSLQPHPQSSPMPSTAIGYATAMAPDDGPPDHPDDSGCLTSRPMVEHELQAFDARLLDHTDLLVDRLRLLLPVHKRTLDQLQCRVRLSPLPSTQSMDQQMMSST